MPYWSVHSSLYKNLPNEVVQSLEEAVRLTAIGNYRDAGFAFTALSREEFRHLPVLIIERSNWYERTGNERERFIYLSSVNRPDGKSAADVDEWDLIKLLKCNSQFYTCGSVKDNVSTIVETHLRLAKKDVESYTDIEVCKPNVDGTLI